MADAMDLLHQGFLDGVAALLGRVPEVEHVLGESSPDDVRARGYDAAQRALAPLVWRAVTGDALTTEQVRQLLGVSRQALHKRVAGGSLIGLPVDRTTLFPAWQFDEDGVRSIVSVIVDAFRREVGDSVDPRMIVSWAATPQPELEDEAPAEFLRRHGDDEAVVRAAERAAAALGR